MSYSPLLFNRNTLTNILSPVGATTDSALVGDLSAYTNFTPLSANVKATLVAIDSALGFLAPINNPTFTGTVSGVTKSMVGLSNVDDVQQLPLSYLDTDNTLVTNSDSKVASQKAVKYYIDNNVGASANKSLSNLVSPVAINQDINLNGNTLTGLRHFANPASASSWIEKEYIHSIALTGSSTLVASAFTFAFASFDGVVILYKIKEDTTNYIRIGQISLATDTSVVSVIDNFAETGPIGVSWDAVVVGSNVELSYTTSNANNCTLRADVTRLKT